MSTTKFKGTPIQLNGNFIAVGAQAPQVQLIKGDLSVKTLADYKGKWVVMNIFPSLDTGVCATSVRKFNKLVALQPNAVVLCISRDLPFAQSRFCATEGIDNVVTLSDLRRDSTFGTDYGIEMCNGPLAGLLARAVVVVSPEGKVCHAQLVPEITTEPNYEAAIAVIGT